MIGLEIRHATTLATKDVTVQPHRRDKITVHSVLVMFNDSDCQLETVTDSRPNS